MGKKAAVQANIPGMPPPAPKQAPAPKKEKAAPKQEAVPEAVAPPKAAAKKAAAAPKEPVPKAAATPETAPQAPPAAKAKAAAAGAKAPAAKAAGAKAGAKAKASQPEPPVVEPVTEADEAKKKKTRRGGAKKKAGDGDDFADEVTTKATVNNLAKQEADRAAAAASKDPDLEAINKKVCIAESQIAKGGAGYPLRKELENVMEEIDKQVASKKAKVPKATGPAAMLAQSLQELEEAEGADFDLGMLEDVRKQLDDARAAEVYGALKTSMAALKARCEAGIKTIASAAQSNANSGGKGSGAGKNDALLQEQREAAALQNATRRLATLLGKEGEDIPASSVFRQTLTLDPEVMAYLFLPPHSFKQRFERHHHVVIEGNRAPKGAGKTASTVPKDLTLTGAGSAEVEKCSAALQSFDSYSETKEEVEIGYTLKDEIEHEFSVICVKPRTSKGTTLYGSKANVSKAFARAMAPKAEGPMVSATLTIDAAKVQAMRSLLNGWRITTEADIKVDAPESGPAKITIKAKSQEAVDAAKEKVQTFDKAMAMEVFQCDAVRVQQTSRMAYREATEAHKDVIVARDEEGLRLVGPPAEVKQLKEKLQVLAKKSAQETTKFEVSAEQIRIFGRENLQQISRKSGADVRRSRDSGDNSLAIVGDEEAIQKAKSAIQEVLEKEGATDSLSISEELVKALLINSGAKIRDIEKRLGVSMNIDKKDTKVMLLGSASGLQDAKAELEEMQAQIDKEAAETHISNVEVPSEHIRFIIGPKGRELKKIRDTCGVQVNVRDSGEETSIVEVKGKEDDVVKAEAMIQEILATSDKVPVRDADKSKGKGKNKSKEEGKGKGKSKGQEASPKKEYAPKAEAFKEGEMDFPTLGGDGKAPAQEADDKPKTAALGAWGKKAEEKEAKKAQPTDSVESFPTLGAKKAQPEAAAASPVLNGKASPKQVPEEDPEEAPEEEQEADEKEVEAEEEDQEAGACDDPFAMMSGMGEEVVYQVTLMDEAKEEPEAAAASEAAAAPEAATAPEAAEDVDDPFAMMSGMGEEQVYKVTLMDEAPEEPAVAVQEVAKPASPEPVKEEAPGFQETESDFPTLGGAKAAAPKSKSWATLFPKK
eukprot:TRINITY_DN102800_c0_g1_i1.p1 TRINITY_DN102800_c0_g1~~TRINITY_DN102800_c0_g1_i1.p1  ORF type:complete len:1108 (+),score=375.89 TRINITY_DN102800_c0_g1_i1:155-3478(+)